MKQQTAVEWLIDKHFGGIENVTPDFKKHIEKAKEMEKEQHENTWDDSFLFKDDWEMKFEQYYNETYGCNK